MKILIFGAAGQVGTLLTERLMKETDYSLVLYARSASSRINVSDKDRETVFDGDFTDKKTLVKAIEGVDAVYLNDMGSSKATQTIVDAMKEAGIKRIIGATVLGIYDEVAGKFGEWNRRMIGTSSRMNDQKKSAQIVETSGLDYTLLRLTWLYDDKGNEKYTLTHKGEPFVGAQVTREAVAKLIVDILTEKDDKFIGESLGVSEPGTDWDKPSFY
jgi:uncharacterized protein YbjT (DUF2867 family)